MAMQLGKFFSSNSFVSKKKTVLHIVFGWDNKACHYKIKLHFKQHYHKL